MSDTEIQTNNISRDNQDPSAHQPWPRYLNRASGYVTGTQILSAASRSPRGQGDTTPSPQRHSSSSSASSYASHTVPTIEKWATLGLRQALSNTDVHFFWRLNKVELYRLYCSIHQETPSSRHASPEEATPSAKQPSKTHMTDRQIPNPLQSAAASHRPA